MGSGNEMLEVYIYEGNSLLEQLEAIVLDAEQVNTFSQENVNEIFRIMHTLKGSSAMMEFDSLATIAHRIEDLFFIIRDNSMDIVSEANRPALFDVLFQAIDFFRTEIGKIEAGEPLSNDFGTLLSNVNSLISKINGSEAEQDAPAQSETPAQSSGADAPADPSDFSGGMADFPYELRVFFDEGCGMENLRAFMLVTSIRDFCSESDFLFEPADVENNAATADQISDTGFLLRFAHAEDREKAIPMIRSSGSVRTYQPHDYHPEPAAPAAAAASAPSSVQASSAKAPVNNTSGAQPSRQKESLISVNLSKLDQLSAIVGEIVITESMVTGSPDLNGLHLDSFAKSARQLRKLTDELQDISMSLRMIPVSSTFQKMNRIVRDMCKKLNKSAKLTLIGEDTEMDKTIVDGIGDTLMHMIRNSMDHGIEETEEERIKAGKDPEGEIILSAQDTGSEVIIRIQDDGQGVDDEKVLQKAIRSGLASPDQEYSHREILNFLMMPGFSTNTDVTEFSGRGVGMDVVKKSVEDLGGTVSIESEQGKGMSTTLRIPLTMAIMDGMKVSVGDSIFTIPIHNIRQSFKVSQSNILHDSVEGEMIHIMDNYYPIIRAKDLYQIEGGKDNIGDGILLWLESGDCSYCLFVDELLGQQQIVVKPLPAYVNNFDIKNYGITGCSILGDGNISIILDVRNLYMAACDR